MLTTTVGKVAISNSLSFSKGNHGFQISALLQELMVYAGTLECYGRCGEIIDKFLSVEVSETQVYRLTDVYGEQIGKTTDGTERNQPPLRQDETLYVEADASLILTREQGWKEVKVGRVFKSSDCIHAGEKPGWITHSQYLAHLGGHKVFSREMEGLIESYTLRQQQMIFITDGAPWLKNWIEDAFPQATSILDFYHLCEHVYRFCDDFFGQGEDGRGWAERQKELLLQGQSQAVITNIETLPAVKGKVKLKLLNYLRANKDRMDYQHYKNTGCGIIGSGAIESAHRTVVQKRRKLSGQRWSKKGAQNMLSLRVVYMNGQWDKVIHLAKYPILNSA